MVNVSLPGIFQEWILEQRFQCRYLILDVIFASTARKLGERDTEWKWAYEDTISNKSPLWVLLLSHFSCVRLLETPWTAAFQAPLSMGFSKQEYWSGVPSPSPSSSIIVLNSLCAMYPLWQSGKALGPCLRIMFLSE